jgi:biotin carboxyl carrier protein
MGTRLELIAVSEGDGARLLSPGVGLFTEASPSGAVLVPGQAAGTLLYQGRRATLIVPGGVGGRIVSEPPRRTHEPVDHGRCLYELSTLDGSLVPEPTEAERLAAEGLVVLAPHAGRFWHSPAPGEPPFAAVGAELEAGTAVGVLEVMKTFNNVAYRPTGALPPRARILEVLAADGAEVDEGQPLLAVEAL